MHDIKNDIKNQIFSSVYLLCGDETYLIDFYANELIGVLTDEDTKELNLLSVHSVLPDVASIDEFVNSYPFMSDKKVLVIENTGIFKKATEEYKSFFSDLISELPEYLVIIFKENQIDKRSVLYKQIAKTYPVCQYDFQAIPTLAGWITKIFSASGKDIKREDALYMCDIAGPSMLSLKEEAKKIISFLGDDTKVTRDTIDSLITRTVEDKVFDMVDDIADLKRCEALTKLNDLKALNVEPIKIISIIFNKFATYHKLFLLKGKSVYEIRELTGMYEKHIRTNMEKAQKLGRKTIASVMLMCADMDANVKNGTVEKWLAIELILARALGD